MLLVDVSQGAMACHSRTRVLAIEHQAARGAGSVKIPAKKSLFIILGWSRKAASG